MFKCECGFEAKTKAGLATHKRKCSFGEGANCFDVVDEKGVIIRTYSLEIHGEKAEECAKMFSNKINKKYVKTRR